MWPTKRLRATAIASAQTKAGSRREVVAPCWRRRLDALRAAVEPVVMDHIATISGVVLQGDTPDWTALLAAIGSDLPVWFMWMFEVRLADGSRLHAYKHVTTRRYLHLTPDGRAFDYCGDCGYEEVDLASSIVSTFSDWEQARPPSRRLSSAGGRT